MPAWIGVSKIFRSASDNFPKRSFKKHYSLENMLIKTQVLSLIKTLKKVRKFKKIDCKFSL